METQILNKTETSGRFSTYLAIGSFLIGTLILLLYLFSPDDNILLILGFFYVIFAVIFNGLVFLNLLHQFCIYPNERETLAIKMLIMLSNIPIAIAYFYIAMERNYSY